jgi:hypothetical protein
MVLQFCKACIPGAREAFGASSASIICARKESNIEDLREKNQLFARSYGNGQREFVVIPEFTDTAAIEAALDGVTAIIHLSWFAPVEPVASIIRSNCQNAVKMSTWVTVDEAIALFTGRSKHKVYVQGKPTPEGYKIWVLAGQFSYTWSWRWHSKAQGPEATKKGRYFAQYAGICQS